MRRITFFALFAACCSFTQPTRADFVTVSLAPYANARIQNYQPSSAGYPEGHVTLGGIPFDIEAVGGNNAWNAEVVRGPYPHVLSIPLNIANAQEVHTLINTFYGQPGPTSYVELEFFGTSGAYFRKDLIGDVDVRDHFFAFWTNINGTSTINVYSSGGGFLQESRLDKQQILLPPTFQDQTLDEFRLTSTGGVLISDASIQGLTVKTASTIPEPSSLVLFGSGILGAGMYLRRRLNKSRRSRYWPHLSVVQLEDRTVPSCAIPFDGNDTIATAIPYNSPHDPSIGDMVVSCNVDPATGLGESPPPESDVDMYSVPLSRGETVSISAGLSSFNPFSAPGLTLRLFNSQGSELDKVFCFSNATEESGGIGGFCDQQAMVTFTASVADTYYAGVSGVNNADYDPLIEHSGTPDDRDFFYGISINVIQNRACQVPNVEEISQQGNLGDVTGTWGRQKLGRDDPSHPTIGAKGCALTALDIVLRQAGLTVIPNYDGQGLPVLDPNGNPTATFNDPGTLNNLIVAHGGFSSADGISLIFGEAMKGINSAMRSNLKWVPGNGSTDIDKVVCDLGVPAIIGLLDGPYGTATHFVVATGEDENDEITIIDPGAHVSKTLTEALQYWQASGYAIAGYLVDPPGTDYSDLSISAAGLNGDVALSMIDAAGRRTGGTTTDGSKVFEVPGSDYLREALTDDITGEPGRPVETVNIPYPSDGYEILVTPRTSGGGAYEIAIDGLQAQGSKLEPIVLTGTLAAGAVARFELVVDHDSVGDTSFHIQNALPAITVNAAGVRHRHRAVGLGHWQAGTGLRRNNPTGHPGRQPGQHDHAGNVLGQPVALRPGGDLHGRGDGRRLGQRHVSATSGVRSMQASPRHLCLPILEPAAVGRPEWFPTGHWP
jgi:Bacterial pre-peptidase C-terminal domain/PEP-CTERM motif